MIDDRKNTENEKILIAWPILAKYDYKDVIIDALTKRQAQILDIYDLDMTYEKLEALVYHIYKEEHWIGHRLNNFKGIKDKASSCFAEDGSLNIFLICNINNTELLRLKEQLRQQFGLSKSSIHTSESQDETKLILDCVNEESLNHMISTFNRMKKSNMSIILSLSKRISYYFGVLLLNKDRKIK